MADFDRKDWLRALRTMSDDYILGLLDQAMDAAKAEAWDEGWDEAAGSVNDPYEAPPQRSDIKDWWATAYPNPYRDAEDSPAAHMASIRGGES